MRSQRPVGLTNWVNLLQNPSLDFFNSTYLNFRKALSNTEEINRFYKIAGFTFCLKFAGTSMLDTLTRALSHLEIESVEKCDLTVCIWDSFSTDTSSITFPWSPNSSYALRGEVLGYDLERIYTVVDIHTKALHVFDLDLHLALYWIQDAKELPWWVRGSPLQQMFHWWLRTYNYQLTHAAVVGFAQGGVLLAGKGGAGKSTTALACMRAGMHYVSEDYCVLSDLPNIWGYSIYHSAKIEEKTLRWFPELEPHVENSNRKKEDKAFLFHHRFQPEKILMGCPIKALIALKVSEKNQSHLESISPIEAISSLAVSTMWQLTHTGPVVFNHLKRIAQNLPCYRLHLSKNLMEAPQLIGKIL